MIRTGLRLLIRTAKRQTACINQRSNIHHCVCVKWYTTDAASKAQLNLTKTLKETRESEKLFSIFQSNKAILSLINYVVLLRQLNSSPDFKESEQRTISQCNDLIVSIVTKLEEGGVDDPRVASNLYYHINKLKVTNNTMKSRCKFLLEEFGMKLYPKMNSQEMSSFMYTLARNGKRAYFQQILPHISENFKQYNLRAVLTILYDASLMDVKAVELAKKLEDFLITRESLDLKMTAQDYSFILFYCGRNSDTMNNPRFFAKLAKIAKFHVTTANGVALSNIFHSLTFYHRPMMDEAFYKIFETQVLNLLPSLTNQALSLILRGYAVFGRGSALFYNKMAEEASNRVFKMDMETFITVFYHLTEMKKISVELVEKFIKRLEDISFKGVTTKQFQHLLYALYNLQKEGLYTPSTKFVEAMQEYVHENIKEFSFQELGSIANLSVIFDKDTQHELCVNIQDKFDKEQIICKDKEFKNLCQIVYFVTSEFPDEVRKEFISKSIDSVYEFLQETNYLNFNYLRFYSNLVLSLSWQKELDEAVFLKRKEIFFKMEKWLNEAYREDPRVVDYFNSEHFVMNFITSFQTVIGLSDGIKNLFREALNQLSVTDFKQSNQDFLYKKTDILFQPFINDLDEVKTTLY